MTKALVAASASVQDQRSPAFRAETELVRIIATVADAQGQIVTDLAREDFAVTEDNVPPEMALFGRDVDTPLSVVLVVIDGNNTSHRAGPRAACGVAHRRGNPDEFDLRAIFRLKAILAGRQRCADGRYADADDDRRSASGWDVGHL